MIILSDNPAQYRDSSVVAYARRILNTAVKYGSAEVLAGPIPTQINAHDFYTVQYRYPAGPTYEGAITGQVEGCEISLEFTASSREQLIDLLKSTNTLRLSDAPR